MCGIAGIIKPVGAAVSASEIQAMSQRMYHRGPDDEGYLGWRRGSNAAPVLSRDAGQALGGAEVAFIHRRLTIIDTSEGGWQPMGDASGRYFISFNGEIYNYVELRVELQALGRTFVSSSDTEVLLQAISQWGIAETLPRLTGMFAFAMLDVKEETITLARDPFGIKPLVYTNTDQGLAFASEIATLLTLPSVNRTVKPQALFDYLRFGLTDRRETTLFDEIMHLPAASYAEIDLNKPIEVESKPYWLPKVNEPIDIGFNEAVTQLRGIFMNSVRLHLRSDVPVGAALSGGIDSSAIVMAMRELEGPNLDLHTFSFVAPGQKMDEEKWADIVGSAAGASMHKVKLSGPELVNDLDALIDTQGEPFGSTSIYAQNRVYRLAAENGIKVTLDGQGADEILGGYVPFLSARLATMVRKGEYCRAFKFLNAATATASGRAGVMMRAGRFLIPPSLQGMARSIVGEQVMPDWMNKDWLSRHGVIAQAPQKPVAGDVLRNELFESMNNRILPGLLRYQDCNSMAHSVESRVPFLTTELVEFIMSLPEEHLISDGAETKSVFRAAMRGLVPDPILDRRDKVGFATPESKWLYETSGWMNKVLDSDILRSIPVFDAHAMSREIEAVRSGSKLVGESTWCWLNLARWVELFDVQFEA
jgi:asparagine synthase (glutamine-hydrolysing)